MYKSKGSSFARSIGGHLSLNPGIRRALPRLPGVAVGAPHGRGDRRKEHAAALAVVGGPIHRATGSAHALDRDV